MSTLRRGNFKLAVATLKSSKSRSALTMLGIIIGVTAVICVVCIGEGVKHQITKQINHFGKDLITIRPGAIQQSATTSLLTGNSLPTNSSSLLTNDDLTTIQHASGVNDAVPLSILPGVATGEHTFNSPLVIGTTATLASTINQSVAYGGFFTSDGNQDVAVLGENMAQSLFDERVPLGQSFTFRGHTLVVVGVFSQFDTTPFSLSADFNNAIFIPYATAQSITNNSLGIYQILAKPSNPSQTNQTVRSITNQLAATHGGAHDDSVLTQKDTEATSNQIVHLLTWLIGGVAAIALIVGGVGIMDVMLVSVTERMHEIGIRKAIGASDQQILRQFLAEAFVLSITGAFFGILLSLGAIGLMRAFTQLQPIFVWQIFIIAPLIAVIIGAIFGSAPALKAARKDPIEALRHE